MKHFWIAILTVTIIAVTAQADWAQYLGPNRNATADEAKLARSWSDGGLKKLWAVPLGIGHGGASVHGGEVFVLDRIVDQSDILRCIDLATGAEKWSYSYAAPGKHPHPGSRAVPTVDADYVWAVGPFGHLHCISRKTHQPVWSTNILEQFDAEKPGWGVAQSPVLYKDLVIVAPQGKKGGVVALDKKTGDLRWASRKLTGKPCHVSPVLATFGGIDQVIMISQYDKKDDSFKDEVVSFEASTGKELWTYDGLDSFANITPATVIDDSRLFLTSGSYNGSYVPISIMLAVKREGDGFVVEETFRTEETGAKIHPPVLHNGYLYINGAQKPGGMRCMSLEGEIIWSEAPDFSLGAMMLAGGLILNQNGKTGGLHLIEPSPDGYKELSKAELFPDKKGEPWAPLAFSDGKLLIRDGAQMVCVDLENPN